MRESPLDPNVKYSWQRVVLDALIEYRPDHIATKLTAAQKTISERLVQTNLDCEEVLALRDSLSALNLVHPKARRPLDDSPARTVSSTQ